MRRRRRIIVITSFKIQIANKILLQSFQDREKKCSSMKQAA